MDADEAKDWGVIDKILTSRQEMEGAAAN